MNLLKKYNNLPLNLKEEINRFINSELDIFPSPSGKKLIFSQAGEPYDDGSYNQFYNLMIRSGFNDDEWILIDSNHVAKRKNNIHTNYDFYRVKKYIFENEYIQLFYPFSKNTIKELKNNKKSYFFVCYNRSFEERSFHRFLCINEFINRNLINKGLVSVLCDFGDFDEYINQSSLDNYLQKYNQKINKNYFKGAPYYLDITEKFQSTNTIQYKGEMLDSLFFPYDHIHDCYFQVVTETLFFESRHPVPGLDDNSLINVSEKVYKPISTQPFVVFGRPGVLKHLKELGFKTFPDMFDESYDEIKDDFERFWFIIEQIDKLVNGGIENLHKKYLKSFENILYNQKFFVDRKHNEYEDELNNLIGEF